MAELIMPSSVLDERFAQLEELLVARLAALDLGVLLVNWVDQSPEAAQPQLGWQWGALGTTWNDATVTERRALLKRVLARRRRRGTPWAVKDALAAIGYSSVHLQHRPDLVADGTLIADGTFFAAAGNRFICWLVLELATELTTTPLTVVRETVDAWKQKSVWIDDAFAFYVDDDADFGSEDRYESSTTVPAVIGATTNALGTVVTLETSRRVAGAIVHADWVLSGTAATVVSGTVSSPTTITLTLSTALLDMVPGLLRHVGTGVASMRTGNTLFCEIQVARSRAPGTFELREDGSYLVREDGARFLREVA